ncbi:MAG: transporter [Methylococcaceae bacterium]|nr:transporter [Methylococcaceae bacterium]
MKNHKLLNIAILFYVRSFLFSIMLAITGVSYAKDNSFISENSPNTPTVINDQRILQGLRLGVYQTHAEVNNVATKLGKLGFETKIKKLKHGYSVSAGLFSSKSNFERALNRLRKAGFGDKVHSIKVTEKRGKPITPVKSKRARSTVFLAQNQNKAREYVPIKDYAKLEQEVGTLKAQMQLLLEKLALTEHDLTVGQKPKSQGSEMQEVTTSEKAKKSIPDKTKPNKQKEEVSNEPTREEEAEEAKRGLDTFLRGKKVLYKPGELEVDLGLSYGQGTTVNTFGFAPASNNLGTTPKLITRSVDANFTMRYGITHDLELALSVPYGYFEQNNDNQPFNINTPPVSHSNTIGVGDVSGSLSYNALSESGNIPTVTLSLSGQAPTGNYNRGLGAGYWGLKGGLSLVKTIDPVVFFGSLGYAASFEERGVDPSNTISYSIGAGYSMNDRVSFSSSLSGSLTGRIEKNGTKIPGSSMDSHSLQFNTTIQINKRLSVEPFVGFGLTEDASDFIVGLRFPYRFGEKFPLPFLSD